MNLSPDPDAPAGAHLGRSPAPDRYDGQNGLTAHDDYLTHHWPRLLACQWIIRASPFPSFPCT